MAVCDWRGLPIVVGFVGFFVELCAEHRFHFRRHTGRHAGTDSIRGQSGTVDLPGIFGGQCHYRQHPGTEVHGKGPWVVDPGGFSLVGFLGLGTGACGYGPFRAVDDDPKNCPG